MVKVKCCKCGEDLNHPLRVKYKIMFLIASYYIKRIFLNFSHNLLWSSRGEQFRDSTIDEIKKFKRRRGRSPLGFVKGSIISMINLFFMILEDDNAYRVLFENVLKRWKKEGLI